MAGMVKLFTRVYLRRDTRVGRTLTIQTIAYLINHLDSQSCGRSRGRPTFLKVGEVFFYFAPDTANYPKFPGNWKLLTIGLVSVRGIIRILTTPASPTALTMKAVYFY